MRKSRVTAKDIKGNAKKYEAYREAWERIKQAQENGFYIEAITIQESIISDRLDSFLSRPESSSDYIKKKEKGKFVSFYQLINYWGKEITAPLQTDKHADLISAVDQWRENRNKAVHAIVKLDRNNETQTIDTFLQQVKQVAEEGALLARGVCKWQQRSKRQSKE